MAGGISHGFILKSIVFTGFRWGGVLLFAASGGFVFAVDNTCFYWLWLLTLLLK